MESHENAPHRGRVRVEPGAKRVRACVGGVAIFDTTRPLYVWENPSYPAYYIPVADVRTDLLAPSTTTTHSPSRGDAQHFTVKTNGEERIDAAWQYAQSPIAELRDHLRFEWGALDAWFEEDEEVFVHPRSPYTRIDILPSSRAVQIELDGVTLATSDRVHVLYETGLPPRWYVPKVDVRMDLLVPTDHSTQCPYKGQAEYWSARIGERLEENLAWSYRTPLPESSRVAGMIAFFDERVDVIVDGERRDRPKTKFS